MTADDLLESLRNDPGDLSPFTLYVVRQLPDTDDIEGTPILGVEFDHDDRELNLIADTLAEGHPCAGQVFTVAALVSGVASEKVPVGTYTLFASSQWSPLPDAYESRLCLPLRGVVVNRASAMVGLFVDRPDDERST
jgi:hypothetical protein